MTGPAGALEGLRVIDLTQMLAGPFCTQLLADQGAEVIKIEPLSGDYTRSVGPFRSDDQLRAYGGYFQSVNRNKRSIAVDLKSAAGKEVLMSLIADADVIVENFRAGVMDRLGLSFETLRAKNPRLVYAAIRGFGDTATDASPYVNWPAYDVVAQAMGGVMAITGPNADTPLKVGPGIGDLVPAVMCAFGIMSAVYRAQRSGEGQFVDVAMVDCVLALCERIVYQYSYQGKISHPEGNHHPLLCPFGMFAARDGWVTISCPSEDFWQILCSLMDRPEMVHDVRYSTNAARVENAEAVCAAVSEFTVRHSKKELMQILGGRVPFGPVYDVRDIIEDQHFCARQMVVEVEQPGSSSPVLIAGVPIRLSGTPGSVRHRAPLLGEHTRETLSSVGYSAEQIERMTADGAIL
jgi:crotonobetainyl-CoA:carnitine CoA-transferase CaiB-like acyl-CoA transferase